MPLNNQDIQGLTPLHLAVISGNSKIVKKLLIKGAKKDIGDFEGKKPYDLAQENEFINIMSMLKSENSLLEYCNIK